MQVEKPVTGDRARWPFERQSDLARKRSSQRVK